MPPPGEGVGPVHSREVPLPLTRGETGTPLIGGQSIQRIGHLLVNVHPAVIFVL